jgi:hypothetical protein
MRILVLASVLIASTGRADGVYIATTTQVTYGEQLSGGVTTGLRDELDAGYRYGRWTVQLELIADQIHPELFVFTGDFADFTSVGVGVRYTQPLSRYLSIYVRGQAMRGFVDGGLDGTGNGLGVGTGLQLEHHAMAGRSLLTAALVVDAGETMYWVHGPPAVESALASVAFGFTLGIEL